MARDVPAEINIPIYPVVTFGTAPTGRPGRIQVLDKRTPPASFP